MIEIKFIEYTRDIILKNYFFIEKIWVARTRIKGCRNHKICCSKNCLRISYNSKFDEYPSFSNKRGIEWFFSWWSWVGPIMCATSTSSSLVVNTSDALGLKKTLRVETISLKLNNLIKIHAIQKHKNETNGETAVSTHACCQNSR